jgi:hypothetical protein
MASNFSNLIAAGSLIVAIIALIFSIVSNQKAIANQKRLVEIEEQREQERQNQKSSAQLRPELRRVEKSKRLVIKNYGDAEARNVRIIMDGKPLAEHKTSLSNVHMPELVGAYSEISCVLAINKDNAPPFNIEIKWDDNSGNDKEYRTMLTF